MEESAQILEVESLIPMLLQDCDPVDKRSRLKRVVLLVETHSIIHSLLVVDVDMTKLLSAQGDHQQLPPVVKHSALRQFSHLDQSLFTRFVRLGVPSILLDRQGRARPEIAALYSWKYKMVSTAGDKLVDGGSSFSSRFSGSSSGGGSSGDISSSSSGSSSGGSSSCCCSCNIIILVMIRDHFVRF